MQTEFNGVKKIGGHARMIRVKREVHVFVL